MAHLLLASLPVASVAGVGISASLVVDNAPAAASTLDAPIVAMALDAASSGYWLVASDGGVFSFGAAFHGSAGAEHLDAPIVGMAATPDGGGYWLVASDGGIFAYGDAVFHGSAGAEHLDAPIVGMAATPDGGGYWLVASDGGIFAYGDAVFHGSAGAAHLVKPVVGITADPATGGYWLAASDGGVFAYDAPFFGSAGSLPLDAPVVGMDATSAGLGYRLVAKDGGVFSFGDAPFYGSVTSHVLAGPVMGVVNDPATDGYWMAAYDGGVFAFNAPYDGSMGGGYLATSAASGSDPFASRIVQIATSQVGQTNGSQYGGATSWCAYFTSWVYKQAGLPIGSIGLAYNIGTWAAANGGTLLPPSATPQVGDAVLYEPAGSTAAWPGPGLTEANILHVNIVVAVNPDGSFVTVGGNEAAAGGVPAVQELGPYSTANAASWWGQSVYAFVQPA